MKKLKFIFIIFFLFSSNFSFAKDENKEETSERNLGVTFDKIDPSRFFNVARIQILDKTTAKSNDVNIEVGKKLDYGNIIVEVYKCWQAPLDQKPDSEILMKIYEKNPITTKEKDDKLENQEIFYGWMIASSPSVSGLQHPVYDITALNCKN